MNAFERRQRELLDEFDRYMIDHPDFAERIPSGAHIVLRVEEDDDFNGWTRELADRNADHNHPRVSVTIKQMAPGRVALRTLS